MNKRKIKNKVLQNDDISMTRKVIVFILLALLPFVNYAQEKKVTINKENSGIEEILKDIQKQTGINYLFNHEEIPAGTSVSVNAKNESISKTR